jgi:8-oxo-dGTP pyrophosphatase MutT (NUDIX family)
MFSKIPDMYIKSDKENKKIFTLFNDSGPNIMHEICKDINELYITYNSIIITKDNKIVLCIRRLSFYASYIIHILNRDLKHFDMKKFIKCLKKLNLKEFASFYYTLYSQNYINIKKYISNEVYEFICNFKDVEPFLVFPSNLFKLYPKLIGKLVKILIEFSTNKLILYNTNSVILPGGKQESIDETPFNVLKRELREELNLDICNIKYLNEFYEFKALDENIKPVLCVYNHDKILNFNYLDLTYIIKTDATFYDIKSNFKQNFEICDLHPSLIIKFDLNCMKNIKALIKIFIKYLN